MPSAVSAPDVAFDISAEATCAGVALGLLWRYSAAAPATCGDAIDVPFAVPIE